MSGRVPIKTVNGNPINGQMLSKLIEKIVDILNNGKLPELSSAWSFVTERETKDTFEQALKHLKSSFKRIAYPLSTSELLISVDKIKNDSLKILEA